MQPMIRPPSTAPRMLPMPPMTAAVNAMQPGGEALEVPDRRLEERVDQAARAGEHAADQEREADRRVDVDAHEARRVGLLRGRAHGLAQPAAGDERRHQEDERERHDHGEQVAVGDRHAEDGDQHVLGVDEVGDALRRASAPEQADVLQDERDADRGDERRELRRRCAAVGRRPSRSGRSACRTRSSRRCSASDETEDQPADAGRRRQPERRRTATTATNEPIMNTSPWAKLMSSMMP